MKDQFSIRSSEDPTVPDELKMLTSRILAMVQTQPPAMALNVLTSAIINIIPMASKFGKELEVTALINAGITEGVVHQLHQAFGNPKES